MELISTKISPCMIFKNKCVHILGTCEVVTTCGEALVDFSDLHKFTQPRALDKGEGSGGEQRPQAPK